ncbi:MAG: efflux RND transporter periplasmic adaptor subunit [Muribaculaceae bacterium]|nr:efflux RND transporter periplasmic adaptor subunit [Muribaculaceae bacterium]
MKKNNLIWTMAIGTMLIALTACKLDMPKETETSFETMTVDTTDIEIPMKFSAKMKGLSDVTISPQVSGQLLRICVTEGQQVSAGQTLFVIDSRNAQHELQSAQASVQSAQANVQSAQSSLQSAQANLQSAQAKANSAKLEYESNKNLFDKKIVSNYTLENSLNNYKQAQAAVSQAKATVEQAKATVQQAKASVSQAQTGVGRAKVNVGLCTITSPVSGIVGEINVRAGDQVTPMTQLTIVSGNRQMEAEFSVTESMLEAGMTSGYHAKDKSKIIANIPDVTFIMKNGTEYPHKGRVSSMTGVVDATTGSLSCKAIFPNPEGHLYSGIQGTLVIPIKRKVVMVIPQSAVVRLQDKSLVYKVKADSTATAVTVLTADAGNGKDFIVTEGLNVGDRIVTIGANNLQEGQKVLFPSAKKEK